ncbi:MAG: hypothetical protein IKO47_13085 [Ruminococcus sp.]|nr:hypothetical protein [Ruminococcus sp.]
MNKKKKKKRTIIICSSLIAVLLITPLIVFALVYYSNRRTNSFQPAEANIQVKEGNEVGDEINNTADYKWTATDDGNFYKVEKPVQIYDERKKNDEYLRVRFIPMWYDTDGNVVGGADEFSDFSSFALDNEEQSQATALLFKNSSGTELLKLNLDPNWSDSWSYNTSDQCFYYKAAIKSGDISSTLMTGAQISKAVFDSTEEYTLHIEVLADAIQTSGDPKNDRNWSE